MKFKKLQQKELKKIIIEESKKQKERKIKMKKLLLSRKTKRVYTYQIGKIQSDICENSKKLTYYYQVYGSLKGSKYSHCVTKFDHNTYGYDKKIKTIKYKTNILYLDIDEYVIANTEFIMEDSYILCETNELNSKDIVKKDKILFISENIRELEELKKELDTEIEDTKQYKEIKSIQEINMVKEKEEKLLLKPLIKQRDELSKKIKDIERSDVLSRRLRKDKIIGLIHELMKIKTNKLKEIGNGWL